MGRLAGFRYREIVRKLKSCGFEFDRQAEGRHEIWFNPSSNRYTTVPNHPGDMPEGTLRAILRQAGIDPDLHRQRCLGDSRFGLEWRLPCDLLRQARERCVRSARFPQEDTTDAEDGS